MFLDQLRGELRLLLAQGIYLLRISAQQLDLSINQEVLNQPLQPFSGVVNHLAHLRDFLGRKSAGLGGEDFSVSQDAVQGGA